MFPDQSKMHASPSHFEDIHRLNVGAAFCHEYCFVLHEAL